MAKIALGIIVKDDTEAESLLRCLDSAHKFVDKIFITGTMEPQDKIREIAKKYNADYSFFTWVKDFSKARNFNFNRIPPEYEWIFWIDCDDVLVGGETFQQAVDLATKNNVKAIFARYLYQVELDEKGHIKNILIEHLRERLIRNDGTYEWIAPIHETLMEKVPSGKTDFQGFYVVQLTDQSKMEQSMWRNIDILEDEVMRNPSDPRPIYYLAKAYFDTKIPEVLFEPAGEGLDSITVELINDYRRKSGWSEERSQACEYLSMIYRERGEYKKAVSALLDAAYEYPNFPSIYIQLGLTYVMMKEWGRAMHWIKLAGNVEMPQTTLVSNPKDYKSMILEALFHIYLNTGKLEECLKAITDLTDLVPNDMNKQRLKEVQDLKQRNDMAHHIVKLAYHLSGTRQMEQLRALIAAIPREIAEEPALVNLRLEVLPPRKWGDDEMAIYCGPGFEQWSWKSVASGVGGSEEAVIHMSEEMAKLGWKVTVYADPQEDAGMHNGVNWLPYYYVNWKDEFNVLISWRQIGMFDLDIKARKAYLWCHDIQNPMMYTKERVDKIDKVMFLSHWQRESMGKLPNLPDSKVMFTSNGI